MPTTRYPSVLLSCLIAKKQLKPPGIECECKVFEAMVRVHRGTPPFVCGAGPAIDDSSTTWHVSGCHDFRIPDAGRGQTDAGADPSGRAVSLSEGWRGIRELRRSFTQATAGVLSRIYRQDPRKPQSGCAAPDRRRPPGFEQRDLLHR
jgi:hypothetical protein